MALPVYDFRTDIRNIFVTSQIRSRFLRFEVGTVAQRHSHDLGHEIFLVLSGRAEFEIDGEKAELGPGQLCIAATDQHHQVRVLGDEPMIMYLSVTPHIQPTHTTWTNDGWGEDSEKLPPRFISNQAYDVPVDTATPTETLVERHLAGAEAVAAAVTANTQIQQEQVATYKAALAAGDITAANAARDAMWAALYEVHKQIATWDEAWNAFTARTVEMEP
ncbi:MAG: cupin domain-containing protein [Caldilineaceae bacterium]|nr:cupin domain-containing protein [Caldilineaceae bacterium]